MDPISVSASILGLLGAAAKISEVLTGFVKGVKDAPGLAQRVFTEVEDLTLCFHGLQEFVNSEKSTTRSRQAMITIDRLLIMLTHCVLTFSELEAVLDCVKPRRNSIFGNSRLRWVAKEHIISQLLQRLQCSKASLNLMLTTLNCTRLQEAQQAAESLATIVNDVLATNQALARRLEDLNLPTTLKHQSAPSALESALNEEQDIPTHASDRQSCTTCATTIVAETEPHSAAFERDLRRSRVYSRVSTRFQRRSDAGLLSLSSSPSCSIGSGLSGLSLADVSNISVVSLPIPVQALVNRQWYQPAATIERLPSRHPGVPNLYPRQTGKILLLGISNAGKSTISKQLQMLQGLGISTAEVEEIRHVIYTGLLHAFKMTIQCNLELIDLAKSTCGDYLNLLFDEAHDFSRATLSYIQQLWNQPRINWAIQSHSWPQVPDNISSIMNNLSTIFYDDEKHPYFGNLCVYIKTLGVYKSTLTAGPFDFEVYDVGGSRAGRKKWVHHLADLDSVVWVIDLNGYCRYLEEDIDANQMEESMKVFESVVAQPQMRNVQVFLLLNKADLFERTLLCEPVQDFFPDYEGGADYFRASQYFANSFARLDHRPGKKLQCFVTDALDTAAFQNAWCQVQEKMIQTALKV
ncbi:MAG: hypothetical protein Q9174_002796 [Haloplaca sp. 1 TL-2023]